MVILGLDPGIATTGNGIIKKDTDNLSCVAFGCLSTPANMELPMRLLDIERGLEKLVKKHKPDRAAIEQLFFAKNTKTAISVAHARGVVLSTLAGSNVLIDEYTPLQVKQAITGYGRAEKIQLQKMVRLILKLSRLPRPDDAADGLALAICCAHSFHASTY